MNPADRALKSRAARVAIAVAWVLSAAAGTSQGAEQASLSQRLHAWTRPTTHAPLRAALDPQAFSRTDALRSLMGPAGDGNRTPTRCSTPLMLALAQHAALLNQPTRLLLERAVRTSPAASGVLASPGGEFRIHYWTDRMSPDRVDATDGDLDGLPDGVERIAAELTELTARFVHELNWAPAPPPASGAPGVTAPIDVYVVGLGGPLAPMGGFTLPLRTAPARAVTGEQDISEGAGSALYLDARLAAAGAGSRAELAHLLAHLVLIRESVHESPWWHESSASWLEDRLERTAAALAAERRLPDSRRASGLSDDRLEPDLEGFLWPHYLTLSTGTDASLIRRLWEEMAAVPGNNTFEAMDRLLRRQFDSSLAEELRVFNIWNLFLGASDDGSHYPFGSLLPTPQGDATFDLFPVRGGAPSGPLAPGGSAILRILGDGSRGGLRLEFAGEEAGAWDLSLIVYSAARPGEARLVQLEVDATGRAELAFPWARIAAADLIVQNLSAPGSGPADFTYSVDHDPLVPFDLLGFSVSESGRGALLAWTTEAEQRLAGWNIYRSATLLGPFSRINEYLLPGSGRPGQSMSYLFVDSSVEPGRKYYYQLEGVTFEGFAESTHPAGVRIGRRARTGR